MTADGVPGELLDTAAGLIAASMFRLHAAGNAEVFAMQLMETAFYQTNYVQTSCGQLAVLRELMHIGLREGCHDQLYRLIQYASEGVGRYMEGQEGRPLAARLQNKLDVQTDGQLEEVGGVARLLGYMLASQDQAQNAQQAGLLKLLLARTTEVLGRKYEQCSRGVKGAVLDMLRHVQQFARPAASPASVRVQAGVFTLEYLQMCLQDSDVSQAAQESLISYYNLRYGGDVFEQVANVLRQSKNGLVEDMQHRVGVIQRLIKKGAM